MPPNSVVWAGPAAHVKPRVSGDRAFPLAYVRARHRMQPTDGSGKPYCMKEVTIHVHLHLSFLHLFPLLGSQQAQNVISLRSLQQLKKPRRFKSTEGEEKRKGIKKKDHRTQLSIGLAP